MLLLRSLSVQNARRCLPLAAIGIVGFMPAAASASVTSTTVTSPAANSNLMQLNTDANPFAPLSDLVTVTGTAPGASDGDLVDLVCDHANGTSTVLPIPIPVDNQKWTTADVVPLGIPLSIFALDNAPGTSGQGEMCNVRAIPSGTDPLNRTPFAATPVGVGRLDTFDGGGLSAGPLTNYNAVSNQAQGMYDVTSAGDQGIAGSHRYYGSNFAERTHGVFDQIASFDDMTSFGDHQIVVSNPDGGSPLNAVMPYDGTTNVSVQRTVDANGNANIKETAPLSTAGGIDTKIQFSRTTQTLAAGVTAVVSDTWKNTDTVAHRIDLRYFNEVGNYNAGIGVNGAIPTRRSTHDTFVPGTTGPWSMVINGDTSDPDVDHHQDQGAITYVNAPDVVLMESANRFESWYQRVIPAGGSITITQVLNQAGDIAEAQSLATASERLATPASPTSPATLTSNNAEISAALQQALTNLSSALGRARYTTSGRLATSKSTHKRYIRMRVSGPAGAVHVKVALVGKAGKKVGKASKLTVQANKKLNVRLGIPTTARKVLITVL